MARRRASPSLSCSASPSRTARVISADSSRDSLDRSATARTNCFWSMATAPFAGLPASVLCHRIRSVSRGAFSAVGESRPAAVNAHTAKASTNSSGCHRPARLHGSGTSSSHRRRQQRDSAPPDQAAERPQAGTVIREDRDAGTVLSVRDRSGWHLRSCGTVPASQTGHHAHKARPRPHEAARHQPCANHQLAGAVVTSRIVFPSPAGVVMVWVCRLPLPPLRSGSGRRSGAGGPLTPEAVVLP
jgi:hypothetical protein